MYMPVHTTDGPSVNDVRRLGAVLLGDSGLERWLSSPSASRRAMGPSRATLIESFEGRQVLMYELVQVMISCVERRKADCGLRASEARLPADPVVPSLQASDRPRRHEEEGITALGRRRTTPFMTRT